jgi:hypothetical protein
MLVRDNNSGGRYWIDHIHFSSGVSENLAAASNRGSWSSGSIVHRCYSPAVLEDIELVAAQERSVYSAADAVPEDKLREWFLRNRNGFNIIKLDQEKVGHTNFLPFKPGFLTEFIAGKVVEKDAAATDIHPPTNRETLTNCWLWIASYHAEPQHTAPWSGWHMWQYCGDGKCDLRPRSSFPISVANVRRAERNIFRGSNATLKAFWRENAWYPEEGGR